MRIFLYRRKGDANCSSSDIQQCVGVSFEQFVPKYLLFCGSYQCWQLPVIDFVQLFINILEHFVTRVRPSTCRWVISAVLISAKLWDHTLKQIQNSKCFILEWHWFSHSNNSSFYKPGHLTSLWHQLDFLIL